MACFIAPATVAIITTSIKKKVNPKYHLEWLNTMFWGGVFVLAIEHIIHGEIIFYPPFLTALKNPAETMIMLKEIAIVGGSMTAAIITVWAMLVAVVNKVARKQYKFGYFSLMFLGATIMVLVDYTLTLAFLSK